MLRALLFTLLPSSLLASSLLACNKGPCEGDTYPRPWAADLDQDGYGVEEQIIYQCEQPAGYVALGGDCDGEDPSRSPGADETCNGIDDDCDGERDESSAVDAPTWYRDADLDGYGDPDDATPACEQPDGYVANDRDCDDGDDGIHPSQLDLPDNGIDDDCDGGIDEATLWLDELAGAVRLDEDGAYGRALAAADLDGDGRADLVVGAPEARIDLDLTEAGGVYVHTGAADWFFTGQEADDLAGGALAAGDLDGDGQADLAVGASYALTAGYDAGTVYFLLGPLTGGDTLNGRRDVKLRAEDPYDLMGSALAVAQGQVAIGTPYYDYDGDVPRSGSVYLLNGLGEEETPLVSDLAVATVAGAVGGDRIGASVALGDLDGDGVLDVIAGAPLAHQRLPEGQDDAVEDVGVAWLVLGPVSGAVSVEDEQGIFGLDELDGVGTALAVVGDVDGDGLQDALIGVPGDDDGGDDAGAALFVPGGGWQASATLLGEVAGALAGGALHGGQDIDDDGEPDMIIGAPGAPAAYLVVDIPEGVVLLGGAAVTMNGREGEGVGAAVLIDPALGIAVGDPLSSSTWVVDPALVLP